MLSILLSLPSFAGTPVAEAGLPLLANIGDTVILTGKGSSDPDGDILGFAWTQVSGPPITLDHDTTDSPQFTVEAPGTYRFSLVVDDGDGPSAPDQVEVIVPYKEIQTGDTSACTHASASPLLGLVALGLLRRRNA